MTKIEEDDTGIDSVLLTVENPVRRKIIKQLSKEPSYQLRISKELGFSQQLVAKHLESMEDSGVVSSQMEASPHGPKRKEYLLNRSISLTIDFAPNLFRARVMEFDPLPELDLPGASGEVFRMLAEVMQRPEENAKLKPLGSLIKEIDRKLTRHRGREVGAAVPEEPRNEGGLQGGRRAFDRRVGRRRVINQLVDENEKNLRETFSGLKMSRRVGAGHPGRAGTGTLAPPSSFLMLPPW